MLKKITDNTAISLSVVFVLVGAAVWITQVYSIVEDTAKALDLVTQKQDRYSEDISQIKQDIAVIKNKLEEKK